MMTLSQGLAWDVLGRPGHCSPSVVFQHHHSCADLLQSADPRSVEQAEWPGYWVNAPPPGLWAAALAWG